MQLLVASAAVGAVLCIIVLAINRWNDRARHTIAHQVLVGVAVGGSLAALVLVAVADVIPDRWDNTLMLLIASCVTIALAVQLVHTFRW